MKTVLCAHHNTCTTSYTVAAYEQGRMDSISTCFIRDLWWKSGNGTRSFPCISVVPITAFPPMLHNCVHHNAILIRKKQDLNFGIFKEILFLISKTVRQESAWRSFFSTLIIARNFKTVNNKVQLFELIVCKSNLAPTFLVSSNLLSPNIAARFGLTFARRMLNVRHKIDND